MVDPVASKSTFLCMYMKNHPDTLVAYVKHFGKVSGNVSSAEMKSIDSQGMSLSYSLKSGGVGSVRVEFDPPLSGYEEVKSRLLVMKADAQEALGMLQSPKITSFRLPFGVVNLGYLLLGAAYFTWAPPLGTTLPFMPANITDAVFTPAHTISRVIGFQPSMTHVVQLTVPIHVLESLYTWHLCRRYVQGPFVKAAYVLATVVFGFPIWIDLKKRVREKRIESVTKAE